MNDFDKVIGMGFPISLALSMFGEIEDKEYRASATYAALMSFYEADKHAFLKGMGDLVQSVEEAKE